MCDDLSGREYVLHMNSNWYVIRIISVDNYSLFRKFLQILLRLQTNGTCFRVNISPYLFILFGKYGNAEIDISLGMRQSEHITFKARFEEGFRLSASFSFCKQCHNLGKGVSNSLIQGTMPPFLQASLFIWSFFVFYTLYNEPFPIKRARFIKRARLCFCKRARL